MNKRKNTVSGHKDIARIDQESKRTFGWYVRVRFLGKTSSKFFSDRKHGGKAAGLLAAKSWRNDTEKKVGKPRTDRHIVSVSNTLTEVVGVRLNDKLNRYEVSWIGKDGRQGKTSVSIKRHGRVKAFKRACQIRKEKEAARLSAS